MNVPSLLQLAPQRQCCSVPCAICKAAPGILCEVAPGRATRTCAPVLLSLVALPLLLYLCMSASGIASATLSMVVLPLLLYFCMSAPAIASATFPPTWLPALRRAGMCQTCSRGAPRRVSRREVLSPSRRKNILSLGDSLHEREALEPGDVTSWLVLVRVCSISLQMRVRMHGNHNPRLLAQTCRSLAMLFVVEA